MDTITDILSGVMVLMAMVLILLLLFSLPTMWLWNYLMPDLFGLPTIGFAQALAMNLLTTLLFRSSNVNNTSK